jgi:hypothetical protein
VWPATAPYLDRKRLKTVVRPLAAAFRYQQAAILAVGSANMWRTDQSAPGAIEVKGLRMNRAYGPSSPTSCTYVRHLLEKLPHPVRNWPVVILGMASTSNWQYREQIEAENGESPFRSQMLVAPPLHDRSTQKLHAISGAIRCAAMKQRSKRYSGGARGGYALNSQRHCREVDLRSSSSRGNCPVCAHLGRAPCLKYTRRTGRWTPNRAFAKARRRNHVEGEG